MADILIRGARRIVGHPADISDVRISGGIITEVGSDLTAAPTDEVVQADEMIVMPGMADTHTHLWEALFRGRVAEAWGLEYFTNIPPLGSWLHPSDMYTGVLAGSLELLANGVTTVLDFCHAILTPEHADAGLQALQDAGIRALFAYDLQGRDPSSQGTLAPSDARFGDVERVMAATSPDGLVRVGTGLNTIDASNGDQVAREVEFSREHGLTMTFHNNRGGELEALERLDLLDRDILPAHCNYTTDADLDALARVGGSISTQPEAETYAGRRP
ncbi:MAG: amidohydrolase family protein, partial [Nitriliruptoraceae bacterium]